MHRNFYISEQIANMSDILWKRLTPVLESQEITRKKILVSLIIIFATVFLGLVYHFYQYLTKDFFLSKPCIAIYIILFILFCYMCYEPFNLKYSYNEILISGKSCLKKPLIIAHLSDLHLQWPYPYVTEKSIEKIVSKINNEIHPDFVFMTGDYISRFRSDSISSSNVESLSRALKNLHAKKGVYAILGNNDYHALKYILEMFESSHIKLLRNESVIIDIGDEENLNGSVKNQVLIAGIDPSRNLESADERIKELKIDINMPSNVLKILLSHEPDVAVVSSNYGFDIQLSGHSHGGQCVLPFGIGPIITPTMGWRFPLGLYKVKQMLLFVSAGIGISPLPKPLVRFNNRPEVPILKLVTEENNYKKLQ